MYVCMYISMYIYIYIEQMSSAWTDIRGLKKDLAANAQTAR